MRHLQRAVFAEAVFDFFPSREDGTRIVVTRVAEPMLATTVEKSDRATIHAFPCYLIRSMLLTFVYTDSCHFYEAALTEQILFLRFLLLSICSLLLAVNEAAEVRILTVVTQVEGAPMVCIFLRFSVKMVIWSRKSLIV